MSETPFADKARQAADWLIENRLPSLLAASADDSEAAEQLWLSWRAILVVRKFEEPDYLLNPAIGEIDLLFAQIRKMEKETLSDPDTQKALKTLNELAAAILRHEFTLELSGRYLAVLVEYEPNPSNWIYSTGEVVEPDDSRLSKYESWRLFSSRRLGLKLVKNALRHSTVSEAHSAAVELLERYYIRTDDEPDN